MDGEPDANDALQRFLSAAAVATMRPIAVPGELRDRLVGSGILSHLAIEPRDIGFGTCVARMSLGTAHLNQRGGVQGGVVCVLADACAGWAADGALSGKSFTTMSLTANLLRAATPGALLEAEARPVHLGARTLVFDVEVREVPSAAVAPKRPIARVSCTQLVLNGSGRNE